MRLASRCKARHDSPQLKSALTEHWQTTLSDMIRTDMTEQWTQDLLKIAAWPGRGRQAKYSMDHLPSFNLNRTTWMTTSSQLQTLRAINTCQTTWAWMWTRSSYCRAMLEARRQEALD